MQHILNTFRWHIRLYTKQGKPAEKYFKITLPLLYENMNNLNK